MYKIKTPGHFFSDQKKAYFQNLSRPALPQMYLAKGADKQFESD
jgi:hypothetical protein